MGKVYKWFSLIVIFFLAMAIDGINVEATTAKDLYVVSVTNYKTTVMNDPDCAVILSDGGKAPGITWDAEKGILTLNGYNGGPINISRTGKADSLVDIEVRLVGDNQVHAFENLNVDGTPPIGFSGVSVTFTGSGALDIISKRGSDYTYSFDVKGNVKWNGPTLTMSDVGFGMDIDAAVVAEYSGDAITKEYRSGGSLTVNSGVIKIVMNSVIEKSTDSDGSVVNDLYYYEPISAEGAVRIMGGTVAVGMKANERDYDGKAKLPASLIISDSEIKVDNARIVAGVDPMFEEVSLFSVYSAETKSASSSSDKISIASSASQIKLSGFDFGGFKPELTSDSYTYDGDEKKPEIAISGLKEGTDYTIEYKNNVNVGTGAVIISGKGLFTGSAEAAFTIAPMKKKTLVNKGSYQYCVTKVGSLKDGGKMSVVGPLSSKIKNVSIPDSINVGGMNYKITSVEKKAFMNCSKLTKVTIGANVKNIGSNAFAGDKKLTAVNIKSKVLKKIEAKAFYGDSRLKKVTIKSTKLTKIGKQAFKGTKSNATYKLPKSKLKKYKGMLKKAGAGVFAKYSK